MICRPSLWLTMYWLSKMERVYYVNVYSERRREPIPILGMLRSKGKTRGLGSSIVIGSRSEAGFGVTAWVTMRGQGVGRSTGRSQTCDRTLHWPRVTDLTWSDPSSQHACCSAWEQGWASVQVT